MSQKTAKINKMLDLKHSTTNWKNCSKCALAFLDEAHECFSLNQNFYSVFLSNDLCLLNQVDQTPGNFFKI